MSEADKLFDELGYKKVTDTNCWCEYIFKNKVKLSFEKNVQKLFVENIESIPEDDLEHKDLERIIILGIKLLKAINLKCKELGWIEE